MNHPLVTVLVTHHLNENDKYLAACLRSVKASVGVNLEILAISDAAKRPDVADAVVWDKTLVTCADKWEYAYKYSSPHSKYFMMISDDVMVSTRLISEFVSSIEGQEAIIGPMSNCDNGSRFFNRGLPFPRKLTLEEYEKIDPDHRWLGNDVQSLILIPQHCIGFYCAFMPKSVIEKVGMLDQSMEVRSNDVDYCFRARKLGIPSLVHLGVFALHFGDRTIPKVTSQAQYDAADAAFRFKYQTPLT